MVKKSKKKRKLAKVKKKRRTRRDGGDEGKGPKMITLRKDFDKTFGKLRKVEDFEKDMFFERIDDINKGLGIGESLRIRSDKTGGYIDFSEIKDSDDRSFYIKNIEYFAKRKLGLLVESKGNKLYIREKQPKPLKPESPQSLHKQKVGEVVEKIGGRYKEIIKTRKKMAELSRRERYGGVGGIINWDKGTFKKYQKEMEAVKPELEKLKKKNYVARSLLEDYNEVKTGVRLVSALEAKSKKLGLSEKKMANEYLKRSRKPKTRTLSVTTTSTGNLTIRGPVTGDFANFRATAVPTTEKSEEQLLLDGLKEGVKNNKTIALVKGSSTEQLSKANIWIKSYKISKKGLEIEYIKF